ncbi:MAG: hypothetical protein HP496_17965 [Nitrospira sp.]|nr:hypothetical protein [Nitrospira sp.]
MKTRMWSWLALPFTLLLSGCPDGGGGLVPGALLSSPVVYRADQDTNDVFELYMASSGTKLTPPLSGLQNVTTFAVLPDKSGVVYIADQDNNDVFELYLVRFAAPGSSTKLSGAIAGTQDVDQFVLLPNGSGVVYLADQDTPGTKELYFVSFSSVGTQTRLLAQPSGGAFDVSPDSSAVFYIANSGSGQNELFRVLLSGGNPILLISGPLTGGGNVTHFKIAPNGTTIVYRADQRVNERFELFYVTTSSPGSSVTLNGDLALVPGGDVNTTFAITPNSGAVLYQADETTDGIVELYRATIAASPVRNKINGILVVGRNVSSFAIAPNGAFVIYKADQDIIGVQELYRVVLSPLGPAQKVNPVIVAPKSVQSFGIAPDSGAIIYIADEITAGEHELHRVSSSVLGTSTILNGTLTAGGNVTSFGVLSDSSMVFYLADQATLGVTELYRVAVASPTSSIQSNGPLISGGNVTGFAF